MSRDADPAPAVREAFDDAYYLDTYPDIAAARLDPFAHYMRYGWRERWRDPRPDLSTEAYLTAFPELANGDTDPLTHWVASGAPPLDGRRLTPGVSKAEAARVRKAFDDGHYLATYPDIATAKLDPFEHYMLYGWRERWRDPRPDFSTSTYLDLNYDIAAAGINPFVHWVLHGRAEGRLALPPAADRGPATAPSRVPPLLRLEMLERAESAISDILTHERAGSARRVEARWREIESVRNDLALLRRQRAAMAVLLAGEHALADRAG